jgi:LmbE family N-acetylglucosaminyl deacetylase
MTGMQRKSNIEIETPRRALAVTAHPDDTEFGCSGTVAKWVQAGCEIHYVVLTSGDKGTEDPNTDLEELRRTREEEQQAAAEKLGVKSCTFLRLNDGELVNDLQLRGQIVREIRRFKPEVIFTWDPLTRLYRMHPDHRASGQATLDAAFPAAMMPLSYPEQLREEGLSVHRTKKLLLFGSEIPDCFIDISDVMDLKLEAMRLHPSQFNFDGNFEERMRKRAADAAQGLPFKYAEGFKLVQLEL